MKRIYGLCTHTNSTYHLGIFGEIKKPAHTVPALHMNSITTREIMPYARNDYNSIWLENVSVVAWTTCLKIDY